MLGGTYADIINQHRRSRYGSEVGERSTLPGGFLTSAADSFASRG
jgi:hypothetical protein